MPKWMLTKGLRRRRTGGSRSAGSWCTRTGTPCWWWRAVPRCRPPSCPAEPGWVMLPLLTGALAEIGLDAVLLGCHDLVEDPHSRVQHLTMVATPRPGAVTAPPATRWAGLDEVSSLVPAWTTRGPRRTATVGGARLVPCHRRLAAGAARPTGPAGHRPSRAAPQLGAVEPADEHRPRPGPSGSRRRPARRCSPTRGQ